jgi:hypothetical protein
MTWAGRLAITIAAATLAIAVAACGVPPVDDEPPGAELPTRSTEVGACAGIDYGPLFLTGRPDLQPPAFARRGDRLIPIVWPPGFRAVFDPALKIIDEHGIAFAQEGEDMSNSLIWPGLFVCAGNTRVDVVRSPASRP